MSGARDPSVHGVAVAAALDADGPLAGLLILGPSGSGKSSLALCLIEGCPWRRSALVADDIVMLAASADALMASPPARLAGLIEVRGFGPARIRTLPSISVRLCVDLGAPVSRAPEPSRLDIPGATLAPPIYPFRWEGAEATAPLRLRAMMAAILGGHS